MTWSRRQQREFVARLEKRMGRDIASGLGRHINSVHLTGIARMNRDPYAILYGLGEATVQLQQAIDSSPEDEKEEVARHALIGFTIELRRAMNPPDDDDTPVEWYRDAALSIWAAANETET